MSISVVHNRFVFLGRPAQTKFPPAVFPRKLEREGTRGLYLKAAASTSFTGSGAEYSELLSGAERPKRGKIAGIDQDELVDPKLLADPDSCFCEFKGLQIHHKMCNAESETQDLLSDVISKKLRVPLILLHGFGASLFSWNEAMKPLAKVAGSKVLSFDRPAFGLTSRVDPFKHSSLGSKDTKKLNPYSLAFSVLVTLYFIDFLASEKAILVGHSAGCLVAVETYFQAPERIAALILVAPAILAPLRILKENKEIQEERTDSDNLFSKFSRFIARAIMNLVPIFRFFSILSKVSRFIAHAIMNLVKGMVNMLNSLYKKVLYAFLRSSIAVMLVRTVIDKFGISGIKNAWYDASQVTDSVLDRYTRPLRTKGWDRALLDYTAAMFTSSAPETKPLAERLKEISCPVLIVTGDSDRLVPPWNSERLSRAIPGSRLEVIKNCGHLPQEEKPEEFVTIVEKFLPSAFGGFEAHPLQTANGW